MKKIILLVIILFVILIGVRLLSGDEDTWLCQNGAWVKHGQPSAAMPVTPCN
ncbi:MAG: hypothetical protein NTV81_00395 [Candidatus Komeilibacteria bacterium]|nr:hypothetical protein [Candidatus Komeilibacteria bacterium]